VIAASLFQPDAKARLDPSASFPPGFVVNDLLTERKYMLLETLCQQKPFH